MSVYSKLANVQKALKAPKSQYNKFGGYAYRSCEDVLEAAKPLCIENGLVLVLRDEVEQIGEDHYIAATATVYDAEKGSDDLISATAFARIDSDAKGMSAPQMTGSASSYARKYALNGLFCIDDTKDDDATNDHGKPRSGKTKAQAREAADRSASRIERARADLNAAIEEWADQTGSDARKAKAGITKRPDYEKSEAFYRKAAGEFRSLANDAKEAQGNGSRQFDIAKGKKMLYDRCRKRP